MSSRRSADDNQFGRGNGRNWFTGMDCFRYTQEVVLHFAANARKAAAGLGATRTYGSPRSYWCKECGGSHVRRSLHTRRRS